MMFRIFLFLAVSACHTQALALTCASLFRPLHTSFLDFDSAQLEDDFDQLLMGMRSVYDKSTFEFATNKYEKYAYLKRAELNDKDIRYAMTRFLNHSYTHLPAEILNIGRKALKSKSSELTDSEKIALALTYLHPKATRDSDQSIRLLQEVVTPRSLWHQAEVFYMLGRLDESLELLARLETLEGLLSFKTHDAIKAVHYKMEGKSFSNRAEISSFDNTQWGAYESGSQN